jgi:phosphoglycolate phosphatase
VGTPSNSNLKAVLFDLDGTLIDHFRTIYRCYRYALDKLGLEPVTYDQVRAAVGGSIVVTFGKLIPQPLVDEAVVHFREEFDRIWHEDIDVLPGAKWILDSLHDRGWKLAVFTNKEGDRARRVLGHVGLAHRLDGIYGTLDTPFRKPQPAFTHHVLRELGVEAAEACMIGDSPYDVDAAAVVGMPCYAVATGSHTREQLREETEAAGVYRDLPELGTDLFGLPGAEERTA